MFKKFNRNAYNFLFDELKKEKILNLMDCKVFELKENFYENDIIDVKSKNFVFYTRYEELKTVRESIQIELSIRQLDVFSSSYSVILDISGLLNDFFVNHNTNSESVSLSDIIVLSKAIKEVKIMHRTFKKEIEMFKSEFKLINEEEIDFVDLADAKIAKIEKIMSQENWRLKRENIAEKTRVLVWR